jgi:hypothetical protein
MSNLLLAQREFAQGTKEMHAQLLTFNRGNVLGQFDLAMPAAATLCTAEICNGDSQQPLNAPFAAKNAGTDAKLALNKGRRSSNSDKWLPGMDSNHDSRLQRPLSYH